MTSGSFHTNFMLQYTDQQIKSYRLVSMHVREDFVSTVIKLYEPHVFQLAIDTIQIFEQIRSMYQQHSYML